ncbi:MAG: N-acetyltransferase family protein [Haloarculaceae archaeon]
MAVRPATTDDLDAVRRVADRAWHAAYREALPALTIDRSVREWYDPAALRGVLASDIAFLVAERDGAVVGFAMAGPSGDDWLLHSIYVAPRRWGEGVGSALLAAVEERAVVAGAERLRVDEVLADNEVGRAFYRERFRRVGRGRVRLGGERYRTVAYVADLSGAPGRDCRVTTG